MRGMCSQNGQNQIGVKKDDQAATGGWKTDLMNSEEIH